MAVWLLPLLISLAVEQGRQNQTFHSLVISKERLVTFVSVAIDRKNTEVRHSRWPSSLPQLPTHTPANTMQKYPGLSFKGEHYTRLQSESGKREHGDWTGGIFQG